MSHSLTQIQAWTNLKTHREQTRGVTLNALFEQDAERSKRYTLSMNGLCADMSRTHLTDETVRLLVDLAQERRVEDARTRLFKGDKINATEGRAALHTALRSSSSSPIVVDGQNIVPEIEALHRQMETFVHNVREGHWLGATGQPVRDIVNIGIGGSDLGPRLAVQALRAMTSGPRAHFVANADAADLLDKLEQLDPATTLFIIVSKTFSTQETLLNATTAREWLTGILGQQAVANHFVAVSTNHEAAQAFGIPPANMFTMWDWVGGRYSLWSSVGLSIALTLGWTAFKELLGGAAAMDAHFTSAPLPQNLPVMLALVGIWYRNFWGTAAEAILPYCERLRELPRYLQQLIMESNGKSVTLDGTAIDYATSPVIFGDCGTISQHSFHQCLHQGTDITPALFIGVRHDDLNKPEHHRAMISNLQAQAEALRQGFVSDDPHRANPGNRPSTLLWLERLDPHHLGMLLALFEHRTFVQGVIWDINPFDQFGVELGKKLARGMRG